MCVAACGRRNSPPCVTLKAHGQLVSCCLQTLNYHGGWCRHTAKWWNSCRRVWGPAHHPGPGKPTVAFTGHLKSKICSSPWWRRGCVFQASIAAAQVSSSNPTVTLVQLPNGQTVQVHGVIQAAQPSVIQSPQVQTVQVRDVAVAPKPVFHPGC